MGKQIERCIAKEFYHDIPQIRDLECEPDECNNCKFWGIKLKIGNNYYVKRRNSAWCTVRLTPFEKMKGLIGKRVES